jgi:HEPN domain-containing protein
MRPMRLNRSDFQKLAEMRIDDAKALLNQGKWAAAYYLAGYAVECGLKACIIATLKKSDDWPEKQFSVRCYNHNLNELLELAGLKDIQEAEAKADAAFDKFWSFAKDWQFDSRYEHATTENDAKRMYQAITDPTHGVLQWIRKQW